MYFATCTLSINVLSKISNYFWEKRSDSLLFLHTLRANRVLTESDQWSLHSNVFKQDPRVNGDLTNVNNAHIHSDVFKQAPLAWRQVPQSINLVDQCLRFIPIHKMYVVIHTK